MNCVFSITKKFSYWRNIFTTADKQLITLVIKLVMIINLMTNVINWFFFLSNYVNCKNCHYWFKYRTISVLEIFQFYPLWIFWGLSSFRRHIFLWQEWIRATHHVFFFVYRLNTSYMSINCTCHVFVDYSVE